MKWLYYLPLAVLAAGCHHCDTCGGDGHMKKQPKVDACADIPQGAIPAPLGTYTREWYTRQAEKAESDDFVIYLHEWYMGGLKLGPYGEYHIGQIAKRLAGSPYPVVIQLSMKQELDKPRLEHIVQRLVEAGHPDAQTRVVLGFPEAEGLQPDEAERVYEDMINTRGFLGGFNNFGRFGTFGGFGGGFGGFGRSLGGFPGFSFR
jgi:hypothetical protein